MKMFDIDWDLMFSLRVYPLKCLEDINYKSLLLIFLFQAIDALQTAARAKPVASMYMLLGKTQMKAKKYKDAIASFDLALSLYVSVA